MHHGELDSCSVHVAAVLAMGIYIYVAVITGMSISIAMVA